MLCLRHVHVRVRTHTEFVVAEKLMMRMAATFSDLPLSGDKIRKAIEDRDQVQKIQRIFDGKFEEIIRYFGSGTRD